MEWGTPEDGEGEGEGGTEDRVPDVRLVFCNRWRTDFLKHVHKIKFTQFETFISHTVKYEVGSIQAEYKKNSL